MIYLAVSVMALNGWIHSRKGGEKSKLRGAIMVESAFLLPIIMMLIVYVLGAVSYHSERIIASQMLATLLDSARDQARQLALDPAFDHSAVMVECSDGRVLIHQTAFEDRLLNTLDKTSLSPQYSFNLDHVEIDGLNQYIVTLRLSPSFALLPSLEARNLLTLDMNCLSST